MRLILEEGTSPHPSGPPVWTPGPAAGCTLASRPLRGVCLASKACCTGRPPGVQASPRPQCPVFFVERAAAAEAARGSSVIPIYPLGPRKPAPGLWCGEGAAARLPVGLLCRQCNVLDMAGGHSLPAPWWNALCAAQVCVFNGQILSV